MIKQKQSPSTVSSVTKLVLEFHTAGTGVSLSWYCSVTQLVL